MFDRFSKDWTVADLPDQSGRTVVVTGANSGLGFEATKAFAGKGAHVVMACRSEDRGNRAREDVLTHHPEASLAVEHLDLAELESVASFAGTVTDENDSIHVLCNNAGVMALPRRETEDGFEFQFGVNHLGHFALPGHLLETLRDTEDETRVVTQSSGLHRNGEIRFDDLQSEASYDKWGAYAQSKLANVLFAYELDRRTTAADASVTSVACHPGYADTDLQRRGPEMAGSTLRLWGMKVANTLLAQSAAAGALPMLYAATAPDIEGGEYIGPGGFQQMRGSPERQESSERSYDESAAERLWEVSTELTGVSYPLQKPAAGEQA